MRRTETSRTLAEALRRAQVQGSSAGTSIGPAAVAPVDVGFQDPLTGLFTPYGRVGITARESFRVRGTQLYGRVGVTPRSFFRIRGT